MSGIDTVIWFTEKSRIFAERRYRSYEKISHFLISYYSLSIIVISIWDTRGIELFGDSGLTLISMSVVVFGLSILMYSQSFGAIADKHRECYLRLHKLNLIEDEKEKENKYYDILDFYPNHLSSDYDSFVIEQKIKRNKTLYDSKKEEIIVTRKLLFVYYLHKSLNIFLGVVFVLLPFIIAFSKSIFELLVH